MTKNARSSVVLTLMGKGSEADLLPDLVVTGALAHVDHTMVEWHHDRWPPGGARRARSLAAERALQQHAGRLGMEVTATGVVGLERPPAVDVGLPSC